MKKLLPIEPTEEMLDIIAGTRWRGLMPSKQAAEVAAYKKLLALGVTPPDYEELLEERDRLRKALQRIVDNDPFKQSSAGIDARHALLPVTPPAPGVESVAMPDEIKVRFAARKQVYPSSLIWAMFDGKDWYIYAHTKRHAEVRMKHYLGQGFHIYTEVSP